MSYQISEQVNVRDLKTRYYIDITTNKINTGTGITGSINQFNVKVNTIKLDQNKEWTVEIIQFSYKNIVTPVDALLPIKPIILCDVSEPIYVNNTNSSIVYKCNRPTVSAITPIEIIESDITNNYNFILPLKKNIINSMNFEIVRSDNGQIFPLDVNGYVTLTVLISGQ